MRLDKNLVLIGPYRHRSYLEYERLIDGILEAGYDMDGVVSHDIDSTFHSVRYHFSGNLPYDYKDQSSSVKGGKWQQVDYRQVYRENCHKI